MNHPHPISLIKKLRPIWRTNPGFCAPVYALKKGRSGGGWQFLTPYPLLAFFPSSSPASSHHRFKKKFFF